MRRVSFPILMMSLAMAVMVGATSCNDSESYAELLDDERKAVNAYISHYVVENAIPDDTVFVTVEDVGRDNAPFYRIEPEGNVYMQVVKAGDRDSIAHTGDKIFLRFTRYNLLDWYDYGYVVADESSNSSDMSYNSQHFYYNDFSRSASTECGVGLQLPLQYLGINSEVYIVIKSQYGKDSEISSVRPYLWHVRYFKSAL